MLKHMKYSQASGNLSLVVFEILPEMFR